MCPFVFKKIKAHKYTWLEAIDFRNPKNMSLPQSKIA
jgi:hypothetical protein